MSLHLTPFPDSQGWIYGTYFSVDGDAISVNIMPPKAEWCGDRKPDDHQPHESDFVIYADGKEIGRAKCLDDIEGLLAAA